MKHLTLKKQKHYIYENIKEFETEFIINEGAVPGLVYNWREGKTGDWVVADDNGIIQILGRKTYDQKKRENTFIRTVVGTFVAKYSEMDTDITLRKYPQGRYMLTKKYKSWPTAQKFRTNLTLNEKELIKRMFDGDDPVEAYYSIYKCLYLKTAEKKLKNLVKQPRIIGAIMGKTPKELADDLGIGVEYQLKQYKKLLEAAENDGTKLAVLEKLGKVVDIDEERSSAGILPLGATVFQINAKKRMDLLEEAETDDE